MKALAKSALSLGLAVGFCLGAAAIGGAALAQAAATPSATTPPAATPPAAAPPAAPVRPAGPRSTAKLGDGPWNVSSSQGNLRVEVVARGLDRPWGMAFLPDGGMLVTERSGKLRIVSKDGKLAPEPIAGLPDVFVIGISGLFDVALHPDFARNHLIYLAYAKQQDPDDPDNQDAALAVMRARWDGGHELKDVKDIFVATPWYGKQPVAERCCGQGPATGSFGGRLAFDRTGHLLITSGDRNYGELVQDPSNHIGKILRLNDDGSVPRDNPWVGIAGAAPEVWTTGHRNPLGLSLDPETGTMWESEFGPRGGDEVNRIERGANYGWILVTQGNHYNGTPAAGIKDVAGYADPLKAFGPPSLNPGNLAVYRGAAFPRWDGDLLLASFTEGLLRFDVAADGTLGEPEYLLRDLGQRWRDVRVGPDGKVWMLSDEDDGALIRISPRR